MLSLSASYQTGLQLLVSVSSGSSANASGTTTDAGKTSSGSASKSASTNSADGYSSASTIAALKAIQSTTSGPTAGVMAAIINSLSNSNDYYGNDSEAGNAAVKANQSLSSKQISDTLLSGGSLVNGLGGAGEFNTLSLKDIVNGLASDITAENSSVSLMSQWVQDGMPSDNKYYGNTALKSMKPDEINKIISQQESMLAADQAQYAGITAAMANGTLKIQRASDVQGLDFVDGVPKFTETAGTATTSWSKETSFNDNFLKENANNGYLYGVVGAGIYLSW